MQKRVKTIMEQVATSDTAGTSEEFEVGGQYVSFAAFAEGVGEAAVGNNTVYIQGSHDGTNWVTLATITLSLATPRDGLVTFDFWRCYRGLTGTVAENNTVSVTICG